LTPATTTAHDAFERQRNFRLRVTALLFDDVTSCSFRKTIGLNTKLFTRTAWLASSANFALSAKCNLSRPATL